MLLGALLCIVCAFVLQNGIQSGYKVIRAFLKKKRNIWRIVLCLYIAFILSVTLINRPYHHYPLARLFDGWLWRQADGTYDYNIICNLLLLCPLTFLMNKCIQRIRINPIRNACYVSVVLSFAIEILQGLFHLGTVQFSDIVFNIIGGILGGVVFFLFCGKKKKCDR